MVLLEHDCYQFMTKGSNFQKVKNSRSNGTSSTPQHGQDFTSLIQLSGKKFARTFKLDISQNFISWSPSRKGTRYAQYEIRRFSRIRRGLLSMDNSNNLNSSSSSSSEGSSSNYYLRFGLTIIFANGTTCELLASSPETVNYWVTGLRFLIYRNQQTTNSHLPVEKERFIRTEFKTKSVGAQNLDFHSAIELFHDLTPMADSLNLPVTLERVFKHGKLVSCNEFVALYDNLTAVPEILAVIFQYGVSGDLVLTMNELASVLPNEISEVAYGVASESALSSFCRGVVSSFEVVPEYRQNLLLGVDGLASFFFSRHCSLVDPRHLSVHQDMSRSVSCYYVNSSHNTFLTGSQLLGESSADMYSQLLLRGVRYVEIDVWDGEDGQPYCNHGYTLTSRIPFTHVIQAINQSAFLTSVYPVIIGLENHCSLAQQASLVQTMLSIFREKLFIPKEHSPSGVSVMDLPLNSLCCKILIKSKKLGRSGTSDTSIPHSKSDGSLMLRRTSTDDEMNKLCDSSMSPTYDDNSWGEVSDENSADELSDIYKVQPSLRRNDMNEIVEDLGSYDQRRKQHLLQGKTPTIALSAKFSKCVALRSNSISKHTLRKLTASMENSISKSHCSIYNLPENQAVHLVREQYLQLLSFTQSNLVSVSPSPTRVDSSNPELLQFWNGGVQIVALNQQTEDRVNKMNRSMFDANGSCGYFLKPKLLQSDVLNESQEFNCTKTVSISFLYISIVDQIANYDVMNQSMTSSSHSLSNCSSSSHSTATYQHEFSLRIEIQGHPIDTCSYCFSCGSKDELKEGLKGVKLEYPDLAFLGFSVADETSILNRKTLSDCYVPVSSLAQGFRSINLSGKTPVSILCRVSIEEHVQASKTNQFSLGILKRASFIKRSLRGSFRKSNSTPHHYDIPPTLYEKADRNLEAVSDRDSGFLSNSSMNSPSRVDRTESPETQNFPQMKPQGKISTESFFRNSSTNQKQYLNVDPSSTGSQPRSSFALSEHDKLNIMLEEAAKAEVLLSAEHRKAKSLSVSDDMLSLESENQSNKPALPPKRYQSFREKRTVSESDQGMRANFGHGDSRISEKNNRPTSIQFDRVAKVNGSAGSPQTSYRRPQNFLYSVASPTNEQLYRVIEESNVETDESLNQSSKSTESNGGTPEKTPFMRFSTGLSLDKLEGNGRRATGRDIVRERWHGSRSMTTGSLNSGQYNQRSSGKQKSKYMNSAAIQKAGSASNSAAMNLEAAFNLQKRPPIPPKNFLYKVESAQNRNVHPRSLHQGLDPHKSYSFIDSFCAPNDQSDDEENQIVDLTTNSDYLNHSSKSDQSFLSPGNRSDTTRSGSCGDYSPDFSAREGVLNLHEMSISLPVPVESVNTRNAVKKTLETHNQQNLP